MSAEKFTSMKIQQFSAISLKCSKTWNNFSELFSPVLISITSYLKKFSWQEYSFPSRSEKLFDMYYVLRVDLNPDGTKSSI